MHCRIISCNLHLIHFFCLSFPIHYLIMEESRWIAYAAAWVWATALILLAKHLRQRRLNLPPGPKPWPIIGNLDLIGTLPHRSIHDLSLRYGPIMQLRFGSFPVVVGSSVEMAKTFLKTMDINFVGRYYSEFGSRPLVIYFTLIDNVLFINVSKNVKSLRDIKNIFLEIDIKKTSTSCSLIVYR
ncbi:unnamed protein product [Cuscuta europaea]|uniref:Uncharacterized protein n=1 Tax=Cuscuta europaea TaxID=41803 RepID=A0A9P0Z7I9_CUSEU|nr:unnamed protein product [Cuscuta europaea]